MTPYLVTSYPDVNMANWSPRSEPQAFAVLVMATTPETAVQEARMRGLPTPYGCAITAVPCMVAS